MKAGSSRTTTGRLFSAARPRRLAWGSWLASELLRGYRIPTAWPAGHLRRLAPRIATICRADYSSRVFTNLCQSRFHFLARPKSPYFHERGAPAGHFVDFFNRTPLQVKQIDNQTLHWLERGEQMFHQLTGGKPPIRSQFVRRGCQALHDRLFFLGEIGVAHFRAHFFGLDLVQARIDCNARYPVFHRHFAGELRQSLKNSDEDHLAEVLFRRATRTMRAHNFGHQWIKPPHQRASRLVIMLKRGFNQRACVRIIHVFQNASTPWPMTDASLCWLQFLRWPWFFPRCSGPETSAPNNNKKVCNRCRGGPVIPLESAQKRLANER